MKKLFTLFVFVFVACFLKAQYVTKTEWEAIDVPQKVKTNFNKKYPDTKVKSWYKVGSATYEVLIKNGKNTELIIFDWEGRVGEKLLLVKSKELPKDKKKMLQEKYKDLKITHVFRNVENKSMVIEGLNKGAVYQIHL